MVAIFRNSDARMTAQKSPQEKNPHSLGLSISDTDGLTTLALGSLPSFALDRLNLASSLKTLEFGWSEI